MKSSRPLCTKPTSIWPSRIWSSVSWIWYGSSAVIEASCQASRRARPITRRGVKRSTISARACGRATSKTLKSGYRSTPTEPTVATALSNMTKRVGRRMFIE